MAKSKKQLLQEQREEEERKARERDEALKKRAAALVAAVVLEAETIEKEYDAHSLNSEVPSEAAQVFMHSMSEAFPNVIVTISCADGGMPILTIKPNTAQLFRRLSNPDMYQLAEAVERIAKELDQPGGPWPPWRVVRAYCVGYKQGRARGKQEALAENAHRPMMFPWPLRHPFG